MADRIDRSDPVRKQRVPVSSNRAPLMYRGMDTDNFSYRWVIDNPDRIATFLEAGYEFAPPTAGNVVGEKTVDTTNDKSSRVSRSAKFGGLKLFLMRLPIEFYNEDQAAKQREIDEMENTMREPGKGRVVGKEVDFGSIKLDRGGMPSK
jgi:hypothetical protein